MVLLEDYVGLGLIKTSNHGKVAPQLAHACRVSRVFQIKRLHMKIANEPKV